MPHRRSPGLKLLSCLIGLGRAANMVLRAKAVKAPEALAIGLVSKIVTRTRSMRRPINSLGDWAAIAPLANRAIKEALQRQGV